MHIISEKYSSENNEKIILSCHKDEFPIYINQTFQKILFKLGISDYPVYYSTPKKPARRDREMEEKFHEFCFVIYIVTKQGLSIEALSANRELLLATLYNTLILPVFTEHGIEEIFKRRMKQFEIKYLESDKFIYLIDDNDLSVAKDIIGNYICKSKNTLVNNNEEWVNSRVSELKRRSENGDFESTHLLALFYWRGIGISSAWTKAKKYYEHYFSLLNKEEKLLGNSLLIMEIYDEYSELLDEHDILGAPYEMMKTVLPFISQVCERRGIGDFLGVPYFPSKASLEDEECLLLLCKEYYRVVKMSMKRDADDHLAKSHKDILEMWLPYFKKTDNKSQVLEWIEYLSEAMNFWEEITSKYKDRTSNENDDINEISNSD